MTNYLILIIVAPILYMILGTLFGILITLLQTDNLKLKIVLLTFLRPMTYTFILSLLLPTLFDDTWILLSAFALAVVLRDVIFSNQKFLLHVTTLGDKISIQYISTFLQTKNLEVLQDNTSNLQLSEMKTIVDYPASLKIGDKEESKKFVIMTKKIWHSANDNLNAANMVFSKIGAGQS